MTDAATPCPTCHGTGMDYDDSLGICPGCGGSGEDEAETSDAAASPRPLPRA